MDELERRVVKIATIAAILYPPIIFFGARAGSTESMTGWTLRVWLVLATLYTVPAVFLVLHNRFHCPSLLANLIAFGGPAIVAWLWIIRPLL